MAKYGLLEVGKELPLERQEKDKHSYFLKKMREVKRVHSQKGSTKWPPDKRKILKESEKYEWK